MLSDFAAGAYWNVTSGKKVTHMWSGFREALYITLCKESIYLSVVKYGHNDGDLLDHREPLEELASLTDKLRGKNGESN